MTPRLLGPPVEAVLLDYGLTLVTYRRPVAALARVHEEISALLAARLGVEPPGGARLLAAVHDAVEAAVEAHELEGGLDEIDLEPVAAAAYRGLGLDLPPDLLDEVRRLEQEAWVEGITVAPDTIATLTALRDLGVRLGLVSNAPYRAASMRLQLERLELLPFFDVAVFSSAVGWRKPSPRIFEAALAELGATPAATLMVGDRGREDVDGAHAVGMRAVLLREHRSDPAGEAAADAVLDRLADLVPLVATARSAGFHG
ncbi:MAG TPA: HAD family hydrolase [Candidatus Dormibacteraeota bacterium]